MTKWIPFATRHGPSLCQVSIKVCNGVEDTCLSCVQNFPHVERWKLGQENPENSIKLFWREMKRLWTVLLGSVKASFCQDKKHQEAVLSTVFEWLTPALLLDSAQETFFAYHTRPDCKMLLLRVQLLIFFHLCDGWWTKLQVGMIKPLKLVAYWLSQLVRILSINTNHPHTNVTTSGSQSQTCPRAPQTANFRIFRARSGFWRQNLVPCNKVSVEDSDDIISWTPESLQYVITSPGNP